jgi:hypothetical protein
MDKPYAELVTQAEAAVAGVKDPELRRAAFEKILEDLLSKAGQKSAGLASSKAHRTSKAGSPRRAQAKGGPQAYIEEMIDDGFFKKPKTISEVRVELGNRGHHIPRTSLSGPLQTLCKKKVLRRQKTGDKGVFSYSHW